MVKRIGFEYLDKPQVYMATGYNAKDEPVFNQPGTTPGKAKESLLKSLAIYNIPYDKELEESK